MERDPDQDGKDVAGDAVEAKNGPSEIGRDVAADASGIETLANRMLGGLGLDVKASVTNETETFEIDITGNDREYLLDRRGEALNAVQYLLNRMVYRGERGKKIHVDSEGFRRVREDEIVAIAQHAAEKVLASGEDVILSPLNPYERRLVHLALQDLEGIQTRSTGDDFLKRVVISKTAHGNS